MANAPADILSRRQNAVRARLKARDLDALVVTALPNVLYLTNFTGSAAIVVLTASDLFFITDSRYAASVANSGDGRAVCLNLTLELVDGSYDAKLAEVLSGLSLSRVGVEAAHLTVSRLLWLQSRGFALSANEHGPGLVPTAGLIEAERVCKDPFELSVLREAGRRLSVVAREAFGEVRTGRTEREVALAIDWRIRQAGFERAAFETIVASGANAALPHAKPTERRLSEGDLVVLDFGGVYDSYCVDLTRTVSVGPSSSRARQVHAAVREAHDLAIAEVRPGVSRFSIDAAARDCLARHGFDEAFGHGTGHGLGIEIHEDPRVVRRRADVDASDELVREGMVFTIEPGAYFPGWSGVRIEDDVAVSAIGVELLTDVPTELLEL
jgi:Xaa-Pro aminopeptidase